MIDHFYHVYTAGHWEEPVAEHLEALGSFEDDSVELRLGLVGAEDQRVGALEFIRDHVPRSVAVYWDTQVNEGHEQATLGWLRGAVHRYDSAFDRPVLYAHTKGAHDPSEINVAWRRSMTRHVVTGWRACVEALDEVDAVGCHWLTPEEHPQLVTTPFFGGNYWWATPRYLRTLPPVGGEDRWDAERWIGLGRPRVLDLLHGWPGFELFEEGRRRAPGGSPGGREVRSPAGTA